MNNCRIRRTGTPARRGRTDGQECPSRPHRRARVPVLQPFRDSCFLADRYLRGGGPADRVDQYVITPRLALVKAVVQAGRRHPMRGRHSSPLVGSALSARTWPMMSAART